MKQTKPTQIFVQDLIGATALFASFYVALHLPLLF